MAVIAFISSRGVNLKGVIELPSHSCPGKISSQSTRIVKGLPRASVSLDIFQPTPNSSAEKHESGEKETQGELGNMF